MLQDKLRLLPTSPGVYLMKDEEGRVLYVGKAKSLRSRVRSYFAASADHTPKTKELVRRIRDVDTIVVDSEAEALLLESNLIKEHGPRFNVRLRDDKGYPYLKVTLQEPFPRLVLTRSLQKDGARYFGPYTDPGVLRLLLSVVKRLYPVRACHYDLPREAPSRECLDFHIGLCAAPCTGLQSQEEYRAVIADVCALLDGKGADAASKLEARMSEASLQMQFERAAEYRDLLQAVRVLGASSSVIVSQGGNRDVLAVARDQEQACGIVLRIREGKLLGRQVHWMHCTAQDTDSELLGVLASRLYIEGLLEGEDRFARECIISHDFEDRDLLESLILERTGKRVSFRIAQRGAVGHLLELAEKNARHQLEEALLLGRAGDEQRAPDVLYELQSALELSQVPRTLVCFDISHTQGSEVVAAAVFFDNARPNKSEYRKFRIRGDWGNDDFRSMHEAVSRYFRRRLEEGMSRPDLVVIDGGKGQLGAALAALDELGLAQQSVISLAKREEEIFVPGRNEPLLLSRRSPALQLLQQARDEAHRFSLTYNRQLRTKRTVRSSLADIPGVGPERQAALLRHFGSVRALREATEEQIAALPGFGLVLARTIIGALRRS